MKISVGDLPVLMQYNECLLSLAATGRRGAAAQPPGTPLAGTPG